MSSHVFLSWSGSHGKAIAIALETAIRKALPNLPLQLGSPEDRHGDAYYVSLRNKLNQSDTGILVLTPECRESWWMPWEIGMLVADPGAHVGAQGRPFNRPGRVFPIVFGLDNVQKLGPVMQHNHWPFSRDNFLVLIQALAESSLGRKNWKPPANFDERVWKPLSASVEPTLEKLKDLQESIRSFDRIQQELQKLSANSTQSKAIAKTVLSFLRIVEREPTTFKAVSDLLLSIERLIGESDRTTWAELELSTVQSAVGHTERTVGRISGGSMYIPISEHFSGFYERDILGRVESTMWCTNVANYEGSFGRIDNDRILRAHKAIVERNPDAKVERVFVVETKSNDKLSSTAILEEAEKLAEVMKKQEAHGVITYAISKEHFREVDAFYDQWREVGSMDFNLIDDCRVYVTNLNNMEDRIDWIQLRRGAAVIAAASKLKEEITKRSTRITDGKIGVLFSGTPASQEGR